MIITKRFIESEFLKRHNRYIDREKLYDDLSFSFQSICGGWRCTKIVCNYTDDLVRFEDLNDNARQWYIERLKDLMREQLQLAV